MTLPSDLSAALAVASRPFEELEADSLDAFEERAAIMEHDGGMCRAEAERNAAADCADRITRPRASHYVDPPSERPWLSPWL